MQKLQVVSGIVYDDEYARQHGGNRFYHLNGDIETDAAGNVVYIESRKKEGSSDFEDITFSVQDMPKLIQRYIRQHTQTVANREEAQYICVHSDALLRERRKAG